MTEFSFEIRGLEALVAKYGQGAGDIIKAVTRGVAEDIREKLAKTPPRVAYPIQWSSPRQRAAYFAKRKGLGPYVRESDVQSERLLASWTSENRGLDAVVGTVASYGKWVQSKQLQQPMHAATGWVTDEQAIAAAEREGVVEKTLEEVLKQW